MKLQEIKKHVLQGLEESGWRAVNQISMLNSCYVASKEYNTAVGVTMALAYVSDTPGACFRLSGEYFSKGRDILSTTSFYVWYRPRPTSPSTIDVPRYLFKLREEVTPEDLIAGAKVFAEMAEEVIADSYAVQLLKNLEKTS